MAQHPADFYIVHENISLSNFFPRVSRFLLFTQKKIKRKKGSLKTANVCIPAALVYPVGMFSN